MSSLKHIKIETCENSVILTINESKVYDEMVVSEINEDINVTLDSNEKENIILDFGNVTYLSSSFMGKIISINKKTKAKSQKLILCCVNNHIMEIFQITKLEKFFVFKNTKDDALSSL